MDKQRRITGLWVMKECKDECIKKTNYWTMSSVRMWGWMDKKTNYWTMSSVRMWGWMDKKDELLDYMSYVRMYGWMYKKDESLGYKWCKNLRMNG